MVRPTTYPLNLKLSLGNDLEFVLQASRSTHSGLVSGDYEHIDIHRKISSMHQDALFGSMIKAEYRLEWMTNLKIRVWEHYLKIIACKLLGRVKFVVLLTWFLYCVTAD